MIAVVVASIIAIAVMVLVKESIARVEAEVLERHQMLSKQQKVSVRNVELTRRQAAKLADHAKTIHDQSERLNNQIETVLADPRIQRILRRGDNG